MSKLNNVWIITEPKTAVADLYGAANALGENVTVVAIGSKDAVAGGSKGYWLGDVAENQIPENYIPAIIELVKREQPALVLVEANQRGRLIGGALAAAVGTSALTDVAQLTVEDGVCAKRMVYGGAAFLTAKASGTAVAIVKPGTFDAQTPEAPAVVEEINSNTQTGVVRIKSVEKPVEGVNLAVAKKLVCVGRGIGERENLQLVYDLAEAIGAEVGCTRPIAEGESWMPKNRYIGVSGQMCKPDVYISLGISGQIQHMVGVNTSKVIIAINKDDKAPIFKNCDFGVVGDLKQVVPALLDELKK